MSRKKRSRAAYTVHSDKVFRIGDEYLTSPSLSWRQNYLGHSFVTTISLPREMMNLMEDVASLSRLPRSYCIGFYLHMGLVYCKMLGLQTIGALSQKSEEDVETETD